MAESLFSPDYFTARKRFRTAAAKAGAKLESIALAATGPEGQDLTIDIAWIGASQPRRALVHSSGLHGVEGFAGSAIQLQLLSEPPPIPSDAALLIVHALNPFGMSWLRRANENNVDLNRNFREPGTYAGAPPTYAKCNWFINPASPPANDLYVLKAAYLTMRYGTTALKQAVAGGQYDFPKGLFFGGKHMEEGPAKYQAFLEERLRTAETVFAIDVHTGLGKFGEDVLLVDQKDYAELHQLFGARVMALDPKGTAYTVGGGLESMLYRLFAGRNVHFIGQEFGTYSGVKVLHSLRQENRWHHYGGGHLDHSTKRRLKDAFCPNSEAWREAVLSRGRDLVQKTIPLLLV